MKEIFKDIKIFDKKGRWGLHKQVHTIGWKFGYKGIKYGNYISDQKPTGETYTYHNDEGEECIGHVLKTVPLTEKDQIGLMKNMVEVMEKLIYPLHFIKVTPEMVEETIEKFEKMNKMNKVNKVNNGTKH